MSNAPVKSADQVLVEQALEGIERYLAYLANITIPANASPDKIYHLTKNRQQLGHPRFRFFSVHGDKGFERAFKLRQDLYDLQGLSRAGSYDTSALTVTTDTNFGPHKALIANAVMESGDHAHSLSHFIGGAGKTYTSNSARRLAVAQLFNSDIAPEKPWWRRLFCC